MKNIPFPARIRSTTTTALAFAGLLLLPAARGAGQTVQPATKPDEVIQMSAFEITAEAHVGYKVPTTVSALKFEAELFELPLAMSVISREMLDEIGPWAANVALEYVGATSGRFFGNNLRGFTTGTERKDGHSIFLRVQPDTIQRVEVLRGPVAVLYGNASPGGVVNYSRKKPEPNRTFADVSFGAGNYDRLVATLDLNDQLENTLFASPIRYRFVGAFRQNESPQGAGGDHFKSIFNVIYMPLSFNPWPNTLVSLSYEYQFSQANRDHPADSITDGDLPLTVKYGVDRRRNFGGGTRSRLKSADFSVDLDQRIGDDLTLRASFNANEQLPHDLTLSFVSFRNVDPDGAGPLAPEPAVVRTVRWIYQTVWTPSLFLFGKYSKTLRNSHHDLLIGYNREQRRDNNTQRNRLNANGSLQEQVTFFLREPTPATPPDGGIFWSNPISDDRRKGKSEIYFINYFGKFMGDRLNLLAGFSIFDTDTRTLNRLTGVETVFSATENAPQLGAIYKLKPWLGVYAIASAGYQASPRFDAFGNPFAATTFEGIEVGVKAEMLEGRVSFTINAYDSTNENVVTFDRTAPNPNTEAFALQNPGLPIPEALFGAAVQSGEQSSKGFEAELVGTIWRRWDLMLSYAYNDTKTSKDPNPALIGARPNEWTPHRFSGFTKYRFEGPLDGLAVGGGYVFHNPQATTLNGLPNFNPAWWKVDLFASYQTTFRKTPVRFRLSGHDPFGAKRNAVGFNPQTGRRYPFIFGEPQWFLDMTVRF